MTAQSLFEPLNLGCYTLSHRVAMAPLTRMRAGPRVVPRPLNVEYYRQRASAGGLIITEASPISVTAKGMPDTPGIHAMEQVAAWKLITSAVHDTGGRVSHSSLQPGGAAPIAPSAIAPAGSAYTATFERVPFETPHALTTAEVAEVVEDYRRAAQQALTAGFDGVQVHGANGYLIEQFHQSRSNTRADAYGGSIENRARFLLEVTRAVADVWESKRVGVRLSPFGIANDSGNTDPLPLYRFAIRELAKLDLAYLHLIEPRASGAGQGEVDHKGVPSASELFRPEWSSVLITAGNYTPASANAAVAAGHADAIAFGRLFIANPDLPERIRLGAEINPYNRATFYGGDAEGYTDYPSLSATVVAG